MNVAEVNMVLEGLESELQGIMSVLASLRYALFDTLDTDADDLLD